MGIKDAIELEKIEKIRDYLEWLNMKTDLIFNDKDIHIPKTWLPQKITSFAYEKINVGVRGIIDQYYFKSTINGEDFYLLDYTKEPNAEEKYQIANILIFQKKHVVWVNFGENIGCEFSGKHPALILKNVGDNLIVIPLSSQEPVGKKDYHVEVKKDKLYNLPKIDRWANIHRIMPISIKRIDFTSPNGDVKKEILNEISKSIEKSGIK